MGQLKERAEDLIWGDQHGVVPTGNLTRRPTLMFRVQGHRGGSRLCRPYAVTRSQWVPPPETITTVGGSSSR